MAMRNTIFTNCSGIVRAVGIRPGRSHEEKLEEGWAMVQLGKSCREVARDMKLDRNTMMRYGLSCRAGAFLC